MSKSQSSLSARMLAFEHNSDRCAKPHLHAAKFIFVGTSGLALITNHCGGNYREWWNTGKFLITQPSNPHNARH
jgi:hypothetical protein